MKGTHVAILIIAAVGRVAVVVAATFAIVVANGEAMIYTGAGAPCPGAGGAAGGVVLEIGGHIPAIRTRATDGAGLHLQYHLELTLARDGVDGQPVNMRLCYLCHASWGGWRGEGVGGQVVAATCTKLNHCSLEAQAVLSGAVPPPALQPAIMTFEMQWRWP